MADRSSIYIVPDNDSYDAVEAILIDGLSLDEVNKADEYWEGPFMSLVAEMTKAGYSNDQLPASWGWIWKDKILQMMQESSGNDFYAIGIEYQEEMQGMILIDAHPYPSRHVWNAKCLYVCYLATAPWNLGFYLTKIGKKPRFKHIGVQLLDLAVMKSEEVGCEGLIGLHAYPGSESFYRKYGMIEVKIGTDRPADEYAFFELDSEKI